MPTPDWIDSPYVHLDYGNWTISEDAPQSLKDAFNSWMSEYDELEKQGIHV